MKTNSPEKIVEVYHIAEQTFGLRLFTCDRSGHVVESEPKGTAKGFPEAWHAAEQIAEPWGARVRYNQNEHETRRNYGLLQLTPADCEAFSTIE